MRFVAALLGLLLVGSAAHADDRPEWAFPKNPPPGPAFDSVTMLQVPGSDRQYTRAQVNDRFAPPDWFPQEHPAMPRAVASGGTRPAGAACIFCHLPSGDGHPESAGIAGLPEAYITRQMDAFRTGQRSNVRAIAMIAVAKALTDRDIAEAARYYAALTPRPGYVKVIETETVPKSYVGAGGMRFAAPEGGSEALGSRIINLPQDAESAELRDPHSGFVDYVPPGSIARGEELATTGGGKTSRCGVCHGADFRGRGDIPSIRGRHALYLYRQLHDMREGDRTGGQTALMAAVVAPLSDDDMIALAAFMASREP